GAKSVDVDWKQQKATVYGFVDARKVLRAAQATGKKVEPWPYVPYELMAYPYAAGVYDKKAPPNFVRGTDEPGVATLNPVEENIPHVQRRQPTCLLHHVDTLHIYMYINK
ncbi:heavy metal-associated isoprenylated plant protein 26, partial [Phtheirospermum japonicum]